jgi:hypothetical protein
MNGERSGVGRFGLFHNRIQCESACVPKEVAKGNGECVGRVCGTSAGEFKWFAGLMYCLARQ